MRGFSTRLLTGRVASITTELALDPVTGQYVINGRTDRRTHQHELGLFVQDAFRVAPTSDAQHRAALRAAIAASDR